ncbi:hypothetical protein BH20ACI2_BH20ACI2_18770 [soil metagenome]
MSNRHKLLQKLSVRYNYKSCPVPLKTFNFRCARGVLQARSANMLTMIQNQFFDALILGRVVTRETRYII